MGIVTTLPGHTFSNEPQSLVRLLAYNEHQDPSRVQTPYVIAVAVGAAHAGYDLTARRSHRRHSSRHDGRSSVYHTFPGLRR